MIIAGRSLTFREKVLYDATMEAVKDGESGPEAYDRTRRSYDIVATLLGDTIKGDFWDWLKQELGIDPQLGCCPVCGGVTPPAEHLHCLSQLGMWPEKGTTYNDDV